jgi:hypothetical protein
MIQRIKDWWKYFPLGKKRHDEINEEVRERMELLKRITESSTWPDISMQIGIGNGRGQQFLARDAEDNWWVTDHDRQVAIKLSNPQGLMEVLTERHQRGDL